MGGAQRKQLAASMMDQQLRNSYDPRMWQDQMRGLGSGGSEGSQWPLGGQGLSMPSAGGSFDGAT
eukprot:1897958-Rhodomonas_salina.1